MAERNKSIWVDIVGGLALAIALGIGGWSLMETASAPKVYATKVEVNDRVKELKDDSTRDRDQIRKDVSDKLEDLQTEQRLIKRNIEDIKNILINNR